CAVQSPQGTPTNRRRAVPWNEHLRTQYKATTVDRIVRKICLALHPPSLKRYLPKSNSAELLLSYMDFAIANGSRPGYYLSGKRKREYSRTSLSEMTKTPRIYP